MRCRSTRAQLRRRLSPWRSFAHNWICRISCLPAGRSLVRCKQRLRRNGEYWVEARDPTYATGGSGDCNAPEKPPLISSSIDSSLAEKSAKKREVSLSSGSRDSHTAGSPALEIQSTSKDVFPDPAGANSRINLLRNPLDNLRIR